MPRWNIEEENEILVLRALAAARRNHAGIKEITTRVNDFLSKGDSRRRLREDQVQEVLASLETQGKASKWSEAPAIWGINAEGRKQLRSPE